MYDIFDKRIKAAHNKLKKLENNSAPTIPKYGLSSSSSFVFELTIMHGLTRPFNILLSDYTADPICLCTGIATPGSTIVDMSPNTYPVAAWNYDGNDSLTITITGDVPSVGYRFSSDVSSVWIANSDASGNVTGYNTGIASNLRIAGETFYSTVHRSEFLSSYPAILDVPYTNLFKFGTPAVAGIASPGGEQLFYDGDALVTCSFDPLPRHTYTLIAIYGTFFDAITHTF